MALITSENRNAWQGLADDCAKTRPSKGKRVRVTSGKHKGKEGIVTWHGRDQFADNRYQTDAQLMLRDFMGTWGFRCRISTASESFFVKAEKVEIIHDEPNHSTALPDDQDQDCRGRGETRDLH